MRKPHLRSLRTTRKKVGAPPGTLVHVGEQKVERIHIHTIDYDADRLAEKEISPDRIESCCELKDTRTVSWINVDGLHDVEKIAALGRCFNLHSLVVEDILNTEHRPKMEDYGDYLFLVVKMLEFDADNGGIRAEQVSLILGPRHVISFQEVAGDVFEGVRERLRGAKGRIRSRGADYLAYALLDSVVDSYFVILEKLGDAIEDLEDELVTRSTPGTLEKIHRYKREMILLRRSIWPLREVISGLQREGTTLVAAETAPFLRDVYDHSIQVLDTVETFRDIISGMIDLYLSSVSNRMNEVMKVLTVMATIFIPLTFLVGVYGMNFEYMPELEWKWSYPLLWGIMIAMAVGMAVYFKKKRWW